MQTLRRTRMVAKAAPVRRRIRPHHRCATERLEDSNFVCMRVYWVRRDVAILPDGPRVGEIWVLRKTDDPFARDIVGIMQPEAFARWRHKNKCNITFD